MLLGLNIRDIVLIDRLDLVLRPGLCVLTGETGAGKSILLDALGLALVPGGDQPLGVLEHLVVGRATGGSLCVRHGLSLGFHFAAVETHGRMVAGFSARSTWAVNPNDMLGSGPRRGGSP